MQQMSQHQNANTNLFDRHQLHGQTHPQYPQQRHVLPVAVRTPTEQSSYIQQQARHLTPPPQQSDSPSELQLPLSPENVNTRLFSQPKPRSKMTKISQNAQERSPSPSPSRDVKMTDARSEKPQFSSLEDWADSQLASRGKFATPMSTVASIPLPTQPVDLASSTDAIALRSTLNLLMSQRDRCRKDILELDRLKRHYSKNPVDFFDQAVAPMIDEYPTMEHDSSVSSQPAKRIKLAEDAPVDRNRLGMPGPQAIYRCPNIQWAKYGIVPVQRNPQVAVMTGPIDLSGFTISSSAALHASSGAISPGDASSTPTPPPPAADQTVSLPNALALNAWPQFTPRTGLGQNPLRSYRSTFENNAGSGMMNMATAQ